MKFMSGAKAMGKVFGTEIKIESKAKETPVATTTTSTVATEITWKEIKELYPRYVEFFDKLSKAVDAEYKGMEDDEKLPMDEAFLKVVKAANVAKTEKEIRAVVDLMFDTIVDMVVSAMSAEDTVDLAEVKKVTREYFTVTFKDAIDTVIKELAVA